MNDVGRTATEPESASPMMRPPRPTRRVARLADFDYGSAGAYFITVCAHGRAFLFAEDQYSEAVVSAWRDLPAHYVGLRLDEFVILPNHVHGIVMLDPSDAAGGDARARAGLKPAPTKVPEVVRALKTFSARAINREYIITNPDAGR